MGDYATAPFTVAESSDGTFELLVIIICVVLLALCVVIVLFCCRRRWEPHPEPKAPEAPRAPEQPTSANPAVANLIPPLFYTEGLRDPLMQEDLRERLHGPVIVNPSVETISQ
jgi:hypothetical protein